MEGFDSVVLLDLQTSDLLKSHDSLDVRDLRGFQGPLNRRIPGGELSRKLKWGLNHSPSPQPPPAWTWRIIPLRIRGVILTMFRFRSPNTKSHVYKSWQMILLTDHTPNAFSYLFQLLFGRLRFSQKGCTNGAIGTQLRYQLLRIGCFFQWRKFLTKNDDWSTV